MGKKKEKPELTEKYDVLIGYINEFDYVSPEYSLTMNGHPVVGRVYRLIKDSKGYRLHVGRENNTLGLDGFFLGKSLIGEQPHFKFNISLVTPKNYLTLDLDPSDATQVLEWLESDSSDLWEILNLEDEGKIEPLIQSLEQVQQHAVEIMADYLEGEDNDDLDDRNILSTRLSNALSNIYERDPEFFAVIVDLLEYVSGTYGDKYESGEIPNLSKRIVTHTGDLGKGANLFNIFKYSQRYATKGFAKSENISDIYKVIHYALFELQRRNNLPPTPANG